MPQPSNSIHRWPCSCGRSAVARALAAAKNATDLHVGARLGERKERRIETRLDARSKQRFHGVVERALQVAKRDVRVDRKPFDLMKGGRMCSVERIVAVNFSGTHDAQPAVSSSAWCESAPETCACAAAGGRAAVSSLAGDEQRIRVSRAGWFGGKFNASKL